MCLLFLYKHSPQYLSNVEKIQNKSSNNHEFHHPKIISVRTGDVHISRCQEKIIGKRMITNV